ncbi:tetratricopeptide repeat protein [Neobacillus dielmonensis]|uniref:tetratricopeptide repeat protein n=1 Tax=Neobacillus dielmonensis TaxID=1347369 RepID=UPI0005A928F7|nr:tetratricopeptide repeat protein [Neobacillus dielmonensis]
MYTCPDCNSELDEFKGKLICSNDDCNFSILKSNYVPSNTKWNKRMTSGNRYWYKEAFENYPSIIAHEYWRLFDMIDQGQTFGALLQLKDVFEVMIKLPTLVSVSHIYHKKNRSDVENKIILNLVEKHLSLGDWKRIAQTIVQRVQTEGPIFQILNNIISIYEDIPAWRNKQIGHGALTYDEEVLQNDIENKLLSIRAYLIENEHFYQQFSLFLQDENKEKKKLIGKTNARGLTEKFTNVYIEYEGNHQTLYPYIFVEDGKIFFFDSFSKYDFRTSLLNYPEGVKRTNLKNINDLMKTVYTSFNQSHQVGQLTEHSFEEDSYSLIEEKVTQKMQEVDDFERPTYLENWLTTNIQKRNKGVFLLQMERGTGKTTFSRALDELSLGKIKIANTSVRCHYINDSYSYKLKNFFTNLIDQLRMDKKGNTVISSIHQISETADNKKKEFANLLNLYHKEHQKFFGKDKLMLVIDGLDEIPAKSKLSIYDFIPSADMLDENVFLLLTSRTNDEISEYSRNRIRFLKVSDKKVSTKNEQEHVDMLNNYVRKYIFQTNDLSKEQEKLKDWLLDHADFRFIYLKLLKEIYKIKPQDEIMKLPKGKELFDYYFNSLESLYGEKFFKNIMQLLSIIATSYEPLTYREISSLMGEDKATFKLLAYLIDIRGFIKIERSYRGNLITISHINWKKIIIQRFGSAIKQLVESWAEEQYISEELLETIDWSRAENDGLTYFITYLHDYIIEYCPEKYSEAKVSAYYFNALRNPTLYKNQTIYLLFRRYVIQTKYILTIEKYEYLVNFAEGLAEVLAQRGNTLHELKVYDEAQHDFTEAIQILKKLISEKKLDKALELGNVLNDRGTVLNLMGQTEQALDDYNEAIFIFQNKMKNGDQMDKEDLSMALMNRGTIYLKKKRNKDALADLNEAIAIHSEMKENEGSEDHFIAVALMNRGAILTELQQNEKALEDFNRAVRINEKLLEFGKLKDIGYFATLLTNRGAVLETMNKNEEALASYDESIEEFKRAEEEGKPFDRSIFAIALGNRGNLLRESGKMEDAIQQYTEAIAILTKLVENGLLYNEKNLSDIFVSRGNAWNHMNSFEEAYIDYTEAINILKRLSNEGNLEEKIELADVLLSRGFTHLQLNQNEKALSDYNECITIMKKLSNKGVLADKNKLAKALQNRGAVYFQLIKVDKALIDFSKGLEIRRELYEQGKLKELSDLAEILLNRGAAYHDSGQYEKAISDYTESIKIWRTIISEKGAAPAANLGAALFNRMLLYKEQELTSEALIDCNDYIEFQRMLLKCGAPNNVNQLLTVIRERGEIIQKHHFSDENVIDHTMAIDLITELIGSIDFNDYPESDKINLFMVRANMFYEMMLFEEAIEDYDTSINLVKRKASKGMSNSDYVSAVMLNNRGQSKFQLNQVMEGVSDLDEAIMLLKKLSSQGNEQAKQLLSTVIETRESMMAGLELK